MCTLHPGGLVSKLWGQGQGQGQEPISNGMFVWLVAVACERKKPFAILWHKMWHPEILDPHFLWDDFPRTPLEYGSLSLTHSLAPAF